MNPVEIQISKGMIEQQENIRSIKSLLKTISRALQERKDQNIQYQVSIKKRSSEISFFLNQFVLSALMRREYKVKIQKTVINLINYESLSVRDIGQYKYIQNHLKNSQRLSIMMRSLKFKKFQDEQYKPAILHVNQTQELNTIKASLFFEQAELSSLEYFKKIITLYSKYNTWNFYDKQFQHLYFQNVSLAGCEAQKNTFNIVFSYLQENAKMKKFLIIKLINMILFKQQQKQEILKILYFIVLIQSIYYILTPTSYLNHIFSPDDSILISLLIAKNSRIRQFLPVTINFQTNQIVFQQTCKLMYYILQNSLSKHSFILYLGLDLLHFVRDIYRNGISFELNRQNIAIFEGRMVYCLTKPITITKTIQQLSSINPKLARTLLNLKNSSGKSFDFRSIYDQQNIRQKRIEQIHNIYTTLLQVSEIMNLNQFAAPSVQFLQKLQTFKIFKHSFIDYSVFLATNKQSANDFKQKVIKELKIIEKLIIQKIDILIEIHQKQNYQVKDQHEKSQKNRSQYYHINNNKVISHSQNIFQSLFRDKFDRPSQQDFKVTPKLPIHGVVGSYQSYQSTTSSQLDEFIISQKNLHQDYKYKYCLATKSLPKNRTKEKISMNIQLYKKLAYSSIKPGFYYKIRMIARKLQKIKHHPANGGIHSVEAIFQNHLGIQIHQEYFCKRKTIDFSQFSPEKAKDLFYRLLIPRQFQKQQEISLAQKQKSFKMNRHSEKRIFSQSDLQIVSKKLLRRISIAFQSVTKLQIKLQLLLLRHLMIDNLLNNENYPNLIPRLNILKCLVDTNISNKIKQPTFLEEHYINQSINSLNLSLTDHNILIKSIFLLSLITNLSQAQFLTNTQTLLSQKVSKNMVFVKIIKIILADYVQENRDHPFYYLEQLTSNKSTVIEIWRKNVICEFTSFFSNQHTHYGISNQVFDYEQTKQLNLETQSIQDQQLPYVSYGNVLFCYRITSQITYFIKKRYQLRQSEDLNQLQIKNQMLKTMYFNMKYIYQQSKFNKQVFTELLPIIYFQSFVQNQSIKHTKFMIMTQMPLTDNVLQTLPSHFQYFSDNAVLMDIINDKCEYFQKLGIGNHLRFIEQIFKIPENAKKINLQLLNLNIGTIQFVERIEDDQGVEELQKEEIKMIKNNQEKQKKAYQKEKISIKLKPIFYDYSLACYIGQNQEIKTQNIEFLNLVHRFPLNKKRLNLETNFNAVSEPFKFSQYLEILFLKKDMFYSVGQAGFICCLLVFYPRSDIPNTCSLNFKINVQPLTIHPFLEIYNKEKQKITKDTIVSFMKQLLNFAQQFQQYIHIPKPVINLLLGSIHPQIKDRYLLKQIKAQIKISMKMQRQIERQMQQQKKKQIEKQNNRQS